MKPTATAILWLVALLLLWGAADAAAQTGAAVVRPDPTALSVATGQTQTINIMVENATEVYGIDVRVAFDPALIEVVDADLSRNGVQMTPGAFPQPDFVALNLADNAAGALRYAVTQVNPTLPATGSGVVFSFQVRGRASGVSPLRVVLVEMANRSGELLSVTTGDGTITVTGGQPPAATGVAVTIPAEGGPPEATAGAASSTPIPAVAEGATTIPLDTPAMATTALTAATPAEATIVPTAQLQPTLTVAVGSADTAATPPANAAAADSAASLALVSPAPAIADETTSQAADPTVAAGAGPADATAADPAARSVIGAGATRTGPVDAPPPVNDSPGGALLIGGVVVLLLVATVFVLARRR